MKDIYVYEGTAVLINKLGIKDSKELEEKEGAIVSLNVLDLISHPFAIKSVFDIKKVHKRLFDDLYEWAGQNRTINMYKEEPVLNGLSVTYADYKEIDVSLKRLDSYFVSIEWGRLSHKETIDEVVKVISRLWRIHCFREGNTRTATVFLYLFLKQLNLKVNTDFIGKHAKYFRSALVLASIDQYSEYDYLTNILMDSISMKGIEGGKYKTIRDYEVEKYQYREHKYKD